MHIAQEQLARVIATLRVFGARRILLFGSYADHPEAARDIDLAVEGIPLKQLWRANGEVSELLNVPVDLVVKEETPEFYALIAKDARVLYEQTDGIRSLPC